MSDDVEARKAALSAAQDVLNDARAEARQLLAAARAASERSPKKGKAKTGYELARDAAAFAAAIWVALCVFSQPGTPIEKVSACCAKTPAISAAVGPVP